MSYKDKSNHAGKAVTKTAIYEGMETEDRNEIDAALVAFQIAREAKRKDSAPLLPDVHLHPSHVAV
jgi:hypothetical protein